MKEVSPPPLMVVVGARAWGGPTPPPLVKSELNRAFRSANLNWEGGLNYLYHGTNGNNQPTTTVFLPIIHLWYMEIDHKHEVGSPSILRT